TLQIFDHRIRPFVGGRFGRNLFQYFARLGGKLVHSITQMGHQRGVWRGVVLPASTLDESQSVDSGLIAAPHSQHRVAAGSVIRVASRIEFQSLIEGFVALLTAPRSDAGEGEVEMNVRQIRVDAERPLVSLDRIVVAPLFAQQVRINVKTSTIPRIENEPPLQKLLRFGVSTLPETQGAESDLALGAVCVLLGRPL